MATNFPTSQDNFTNPTSSDTLDSPDHAAQHADVNDAVEAIEGALLDGAPLHIDDANERVGIGTTSPAEELDVVGDVQVSGRLGIGSGISAELDIKGASNPEIRLQSTDSTDPFLYFGDQVDAVRGGIGFDTSANNLLFRRYNNITAMTLTSGGYLGINDTTPSYYLDVNGDINATGDVRVAGNPVGMVLLNEYSPSAATTISFDSVFSTGSPAVASAFTEFVILMTDLQASSYSTLYFQLAHANGAYGAPNWGGGRHRSNYGGDFNYVWPYGSVNCGNVGTSSLGTGIIELVVTNPMTAKAKGCYGQGGDGGLNAFGAMTSTSNAYRGFSLTLSSGNTFVSGAGSIRVYGIVK